jgi:hypothetical protein
LSELRGICEKILDAQAKIDDLQHWKDNERREQKYKGNMERFPLLY